MSNSLALQCAVWQSRGHDPLAWFALADAAEEEGGDGSAYRTLGKAAELAVGLSPVPDHVGVVLRSAAVQPREAALLMAAAVKLARKYKKVGPTLARMYFGVPGGGGGLSSLTFDFRRDAENAGRAARLPYSWDEARAAEVPVFHLAGLHVYVESRAASATP